MPGDGDRRIEGALTELVAPKGLIVSSDLDVVLIADTGALDIKAFALDASGDVAPSFTVSDLGAQGRAVWDIEYDPASDRLFAAGTDGRGRTGAAPPRWRGMLLMKLLMGVWWVGG